MASRTCCNAPSGQVLLAVRQFNNQLWYDCHETLEPLWMTENGELRDFYQGLIQLAIGLHHWRNGNYNGAIALLAGSISYLENSSSPCQWIDVRGLIAQIRQFQDDLGRLGAEKMHEVDQMQLPKLLTVTA